MMLLFVLFAPVLLMWSLLCSKFLIHVLALQHKFIVCGVGTIVIYCDDPIVVVGLISGKFEIAGQMFFMVSLHFGYF